MNKPLNATSEEIGRISSAHNTGYFRTFDLGVCAALVSSGFQLASLDRSNPKKCEFLFENRLDIGTIAEDYWADKLKINARTFFDNVRAIKNRLYSSD